MANTQQAINSINNSKMPTMLHLLKSGIKNKIEPNTPKNITLVLGLAGSYKRDLIKFISGNEQLNNSWDDPASSSTTFPGLIIDSKTNTAFYEYPKFGQSKTLEEEISAKYLLNEIIDYADSIKLIFTIPESQNESGLDDEHIDSLLDESVKLIKNFNELEDSIALVVTRVDKNDSVSDEDVIKNISADLMDLKKYSDSGNASDLKKQNLINVLLREKNGIYTNIGVFKKPGKFEEKLSENKVLDDEKSLKTVINVNTKFIVHDKNNFQCAFCSDEPLENMTYLQSDLSNNVREIKRIVLKYFENLEKDSDDMKLINDEYRMAIRFFYELHSKISSSSIEKFPTELINLENLLQNIHIKIPKGIILSINNCAEYLSLFLQISKFKSSNDSEAIAGIDLFRKDFYTLIDDIPKELKKSRNWYSALITFHSELSSYHIQKDIKSKQSDRDDLMTEISTLTSEQAISPTRDLDEIDEGELEKTYIDRKNRITDQIERIFKNATGPAYEREVMRTFFYGASIKRSCKDKMNILSKMLESLFYSSSDLTDKSCSNGILSIKGQFVKLSDVPNVKCDNKTVKAIKLFASNRVYIDDDLDKTGDEVNLSIIAPTWEVVGKHKIVLDGRPGEDYDINVIGLPLNPGPGQNGTDGKPGEPGGPAGSFLGIGWKVINGTDLTISARGGKGGEGQQGGNGMPGIDEKLERYTVEMEPTLLDSVANFDKICKESDESEESGEGDALNELYYHCQVGSPCKNGGNGGRGGAGGKGGKAGEIKLISESESFSGINKFNTDGDVGSNGRAGEGADKGGTSEIMTFNVTTKWIVFYTRHDPGPVNVSISRCGPGISPTALNSNDIPLPKSSNARVDADTIIEYKEYLRALAVEEKEKVRRQLLRDFLYEIENNPQVKKLYYAIEFAYELKSLERQFYLLHKNLSFLPFYQSLLDRITKYANEVHSKLEENKNDSPDKQFLEDERKALRYLYTATLSKIVGIRDDKSSDLVLDVEGFLDTALRNINKLNAYKGIRSLTEVHKEYSNSLNKKIEEANEFGPQIVAEIETLFANVDKKIESLIHETESLAKNVRKQKTKLKETRQKLRSAVAIRSLLAIPKMIGTFLNLAGPVGAAAGAAITGSSMILESLSATDADNIKAKQIPGLFSMTKMQKLFDEEVMFQKQLDALNKEFETTAKTVSPPASVLELRQTISNLTRTMEEEKKTGVSYDKVIEKIDKVKGLLEQQATKLGDKKNENNTSIQIWSKIMNRGVTLLSVAEVPKTLYKDNSVDSEKIDTIASAIKESEDQLQKLEIYKKNIYDSIIPQCRALHTYLINELTGNVTREKSLAALDISKWKMQDILKDLKDSLHNMTEGFEVQEDITHLMEKIDRALFTMIDLYQYMEDYRDKKELADYIKSINSEEAKHVVIRNATLKDAIDDIKIVIQSNIVLEEYKRSIDAVKQVKYPMAHQFLDKYRLPVESGLTDFNISTLPTVAEEMLRGLKDKFILNAITVVKDDKFWHDIMPFKAKSDRRGAFYIWKYAENKHAISELLEGKEVTLKSDITKSKPIFSAVKFQAIDFKFKFADKTDEKEFKKKLKLFDLRIIHSGKSQYKCNDKFHIITNDEQEFTIEFGTSRGNRVYDKVKKNEPLLSPYTSWKLSLISQNISNFALLNKYQNMKIDLALEGTGTYLDHTLMKEADLNRICSDDLSKYYNEEKTILGITSTELPNREVIDELPGLGDPIITDQKNLSRKPRSLGDHEFEQDLEENPYSTSGACSNMKSSFINNIFNLIGTGLVAYEYLNPVNKISQWFAKYETNTDQEDSFVLDSDLPASSSMKMLNVQYPATESPKISKMFIDDELPTANNLLSDSSFCNHGNLLLLDLVIRSKSGVKYSHRSFAANANVDPEYAQHLAYREHRT